MTNNIIILAAGKGSRMKSNKLKVLHEIAGKPIIQYVIDAVNHDNNKLYVVIGHQKDNLEATINDSTISLVEQKEQLGTGHAVQQVAPLLDPTEQNSTLILTGDSPLLQKDTLKKLIETHETTQASATILSTHVDNPHGYGRILRDKHGNVEGIREQKDCTPEQANISEINSGVYIFKTQHLLEHIYNLTTNNNQKEYYLTDIIEILKKKSYKIESYCTENNFEVLGINTRQDLSIANEVIYRLNNEKLMTNGVTIIDPKSTFIDSTVTIESDTIIEPFTILKGQTTIKSNATIGPFVELNNTNIPENSIVKKETVSQYQNINN